MSYFDKPTGTTWLPKNWTLLFFGLLSSVGLLAQTPSDCGSVNCTSNDVQIVKAYISDAAGNQLSNSFICPASNNANVFLTLELSTNSPRVGVSIYTDIRKFTPPNTVGDIITSVGQCFGVALSSSTGAVNKVTFPNSFSWPCNQAIVLTSVFIAWGTGNTNFCDATGVTPFKCPGTKSKCFRLPGGNYISIITPRTGAAAVKVCATNPGGTQYTFDLDDYAAQVIDGQNAAITGWFTDQGLTSPVANKDQFVSGSGKVYAKLCTIVNGQPSGACVAAPLDLTVYQRPQVVITNPAAVCSPATVNLTAAAIIAGSILPEVGPTTLGYFNNDANPQPLLDATAVGAGTYNIVATNTAYQGTGACDHSAPVVVTVKQTPNAPGISIVDNCNGTSTITLTGVTGTLDWTGSAATPTGGPLVFTTSTPGNYTVKQTVNGCASPASETKAAAPKKTPPAPGISIVDNCNGTSTITLSGVTGTLDWTGSAATPTGGPLVFTTSTPGNYTVKQTVNGCASPASETKAAAPKTTPPAPGISIVDNCNGTSTITLSGVTGTLDWTGSAATPTGGPLVFTTSTPGNYTVKQTVNGCISPASETKAAAPKTTPAAPGISIVDNCNGTSTITLSGVTGILDWTGSAAIPSGGPTVFTTSTAGNYMVKQTVGGCTSAASQTKAAAPKSAPANPSVVYNAPTCNESTFSVTVLNAVSGVTYTIKDKNGNNISGVLPGNSFVGAGQNANFSNIPAGSGYSITAAKDGCASSDPAGCGTPEPAAPVTDAQKPATAENNTKITTPVAENAKLPTITKTAQVRAFPNPFGTVVYFQFVAPTSGRASLVVMDATGKRLATVFDGMVEANQTQQAAYRPTAVQANSVLMYQLSIGQQRTQGKLLYQK